MFDPLMLGATKSIDALDQAVKYYIEFLSIVFSYGSIVALNRLKYFLVVVEHLSFSAAAKALNMSQPPLSQQIQKLEGELGVRLFDRTSRSVTLTPAGEEYLNGARRAASHAERAAVEARNSPN